MFADVGSARSHGSAARPGSGKGVVSNGVTAQDGLAVGIDIAGEETATVGGGKVVGAGVTPVQATSDTANTTNTRTCLDMTNTPSSTITGSQ